LLALLDAAGAAAALDLSNASVETLDNGMTVILLEDRNFPVASVQMLYRVGARNESYGQTGIAHFLEHMAFRDTEHFPDTGVVSSIYARGGEWHGYTWTDETTYFATVPADHLDLLLRIEADRLARLEIRADDIEAERGAVLAEMHMYENYPTSMLLDAVLYASFIAHPYRNNTIGWESDIAGLTHAEIVDFYRRYYKPANAVLAVVGDFDADAVRARIHELFGDLTSGEPAPLPRTVEPVQEGVRRVRLHGATESKRFMIAWRAPSVNDADFPAFLVLQEVLGAGSGVNFGQNDWGAAVDGDSLLYGAAAELTTWYPPSAEDYVFVIGGTAGAEADERAVEDAISKRIARVRAEPPGEAALADAIARVRDELVYDVETTEDAAHQLAFFAGLGALDVLLELPARVGAVTAEGVQRAARRWLKPERRTIGWYVPGTTPPPETPADAREHAEVEMPPPAPLDETAVATPVVRTLPGGIPAIVQRSDFSPSAYVQVVLAGTGFAGEGVQVNEPVLGFSSLTRRFRPHELGKTLDEVRAAIDALRVVRGVDDNDLSGGDDPAARLEGAFDIIMSASRNEPGSKTPVLVVMTGDVEVEQAFVALEERFGGVAPARGVANGPRPFEARDMDIALGRPVAQAQLGYIVPAPGPSDSPALAWRLLLYVLSHGYEGRLGKEAISNRGLAYYIDSRYRSDGVNGWITLAIGVDPHKVSPLRDLLVAELRQLREHPPTEAEVEEAKAHLLGRAVSAAESNAELADSVAGDWLWYGGVRTPAELEARLRRVGRRDVIAAVDAFVEGAVITVSAWGRETRPGEVE
jgi:zinc protease